MAKIESHASSPFLSEPPVRNKRRKERNRLVIRLAISMACCLLRRCERDYILCKGKESSSEEQKRRGVLIYMEWAQAFMQLSCLLCWAEPIRATSDTAYAHRAALFHSPWWASCILRVSPIERTAKLSSWFSRNKPQPPPSARLQAHIIGCLHG